MRIILIDKGFDSVTMQASVQMRLQVAPTGRVESKFVRIKKAEGLNFSFFLYNDPEIIDLII